MKKWDKFFFYKMLSCFSPSSSSSSSHLSISSHLCPSKYSFHQLCKETWSTCKPPDMTSKATIYKTMKALTRNTMKSKVLQKSKEEFAPCYNCQGERNSSDIPNSFIMSPGFFTCATLLHPLLSLLKQGLYLFPLYRRRS